MRQNEHIDHANSRVAQSMLVKQSAPTGGMNNVPNSRAQGSGSGSNLRTPDASNVVKPIFSSISIFFISFSYHFRW